jgi:perosamine synthetase
VGVELNPEPDGMVNGAWMPTAVFKPETGVTREKLLSAFTAENIDARVFFWPLSALNIFPPCEHNLHSWSIPRRAINLPSYIDMVEDDLLRVVNILRCTLG